MQDLLWPIVLLPFAGALILAVLGAYMPKKLAGTIGCAAVGAAWAAAAVAAFSFITSGSERDVVAAIYPWLDLPGLRVAMGLRLDALSTVMMLVVTFVGFLIHLYASQSMYDEDGYHRFFAYMNLFVGSMLTLVLADNLLLLYLGWEGVGLCSYLLIGFWYKDSANGRAAQKAFIVTRVGDLAMAVGLFLLYRHFGTLDIAAISSAAPAVLPTAAATAIAFLLIGGAVGKSAQVPLQTWLPDAMAGPTPVSALIHAATMVTAGVYLIARMNAVFLMSEAAMTAVAVIGSVTLLYSGFTALVQRDIKRVLAYSTISQIGYMFLALGVGALSGAIFHLMTHAFFKALLFLAAGAAIDAQHHEHDMFRMGGLRRRLPVAYWAFWIGAASLSALPLVTAGFYSKDAIIWASFSSNLGSVWMTAAALVGSLVTTAYIFRALFLTFHGEQKMEVGKYPGWLMQLALIVLAFFSITAGFVSWPEVLSHFDPFGDFLETSLPATAPAPAASRPAEWVLLIVPGVEWFIGYGLALAYFRRRDLSEAAARSSAWRALHAFVFVGWGFDWLYDRLFVRPFTWIAFGNRRDFIDKVFVGTGEAVRCANLGLSTTQTGRMRDYAVGLVLGAVIVGAAILLR